MKKCYLVFIVLLVFISLSLLPRKKEIKINYELIKNENKIVIYYVYDDKLFGVPILSYSDKYQMIEDAFSLLTNKSNMAPLGYNSKLIPSSKLESYEIFNNDLFLDFSNDFYRAKKEDINLVLGQIYYTYLELGYDNVYIVEDGVLVDFIYDAYIANGIGKKLMVNLDIQTPLPASKTISVFYLYPNNTITFTKYLVDENTDEFEFIINKLIKFINKRYGYNIVLDEFKVIDGKMYLTLSNGKADKDILEQFLLINFELEEDYFYIS